MAEEKNKKISKKVKAVTAVLLVLILLTSCALAARILYLKYFADNSTTAVVPDNLIGDSYVSADNPDNSPNSSTEQTAQSDSPADSAPSEGSNSAANTKAAAISLYKGKPDDNKKFEVHNMLPGDIETKYFAVKVSHSDRVELFFTAEVTEQTKNLANVLHIKVTHLENGKVIYDGTFADMDVNGYAEALQKQTSGETVVYYKIEVSLLKTAGNEYQAAKLLADFKWFIKDTNALEPPKTGDTANLTLMLTVLVSSAVLMIILLFLRRKKEDDENAEE